MDKNDDNFLASSLYEMYFLSYLYNFFRSASPQL